MLLFYFFLFCCTLPTSAPASNAKQYVLVLSHIPWGSCIAVGKKTFRYLEKFKIYGFSVFSNILVGRTGHAFICLGSNNKDELFTEMSPVKLTLLSLFLNFKKRVLRILLFIRMLPMFLDQNLNVHLTPP